MKLKGWNYQNHFIVEHSYKFLQIIYSLHEGPKIFAMISIEWEPH